MTETLLSGKAVLVVGGSSGIGLASAILAKKAGAEITIASRSPEKLAAAADTIGGATILSFDVRDERLTAAVLSDAGPYDHVIVTPGSVSPGYVRSGSAEKAVAGFASKFWGAYHVAAYARIAERGSLTLVSGAYAVRPAVGAVVASSINAAVNALARGLALEFAPIRVNAVCPGLVDTPMWAGMQPERREAMFAETANLLPTGHVGQAEDVAALILACMTNPMLTGSVILADGGRALV